jgi:hypothetical protein
MIDRLRFLATVSLVTLLALPVASAVAHGIGESAAGRTTLEFVPLGIEHMLLGWDHLLFIAGVLLVARTLGEAAKLISVFVLGHSLTLIVATAAGWQISSGVVDVIIALSLVFIAFLGFAGPPDDWRRVGAIVFLFGLIHGLGLSTRLQELGIPDDGLLIKTVMFNVGVELGQIWALVVFFGIGWLVFRFVSAETRERLRPAAFLALLATGFIGAGATAVIAATGDDGDSSGLGEACRSAPTELPRVDLDAEHPAQRFYGPDDTVDVANLNHVIGDGFMIVRYDPGLGPDEVEELAAVSETGSPFQIIAPADDGSSALTAITTRQTVTCSEFDLDSLEAFTEFWMEETGQQAPPG